MISLAQRVRDHRYSKGWGPDELANRAAISRTALYQIESGKTELPRAGTLRRIAMALDVSMDTLLGHSEASRGHQAAAAAARRGRSAGDWIPAEGGPLTVMTPLGALGGVEAERFAIEASAPLVVPPAPNIDPFTPPREQELTGKLLELLASPMGEGIASLIVASHRMLLQSRGPL